MKEGNKRGEKEAVSILAKALTRASSRKFGFRRKRCDEEDVDCMRIMKTGRVVTLERNV